MLAMSAWILPSLGFGDICKRHRSVTYAFVTDRLLRLKTLQLLLVVLLQFAGNRREGSKQAIGPIVRARGKEQSTARTGSAAIAECECPQPVNVHRRAAGIQDVSHKPAGPWIECRNRAAKKIAN